MSRSNSRIPTSRRSPWRLVPRAISTFTAAIVLTVFSPSSGGWGGAACAQIVPNNDVIGQEQRTASDIDHQTWIHANLDPLINPRYPALGERDVLPEMLIREFVDEFSRQNYAGAEMLARRLVALMPDRPWGHYNLACALAVQEHYDEAIESFRLAVENGWRDQLHTRLDPDLDKLREVGAFQDVVELMKQYNALERIAPEALRIDPWAEVVQDLESRVPDYMDRHHVPGMTIALIRDGRTVWSEGFGVTDPRTSDAMRARTRLRISAPSELLTAITALQCEDRGFLTLDDQLNEWVAVIPRAEEDDTARLTLRNALSHTAGLKDRFARISPTEGIDEELQRTLTFDPHLPAQEYFHCAQARTAVGRAIERALARALSKPEDRMLNLRPPNFSEYCEARILAALRMGETTFTRPRRAYGGFATGHSIYGTPFRRLISADRPASAVYTTAPDMARLVEFMLEESDPNGISPISRDDVERIMMPPFMNDDAGFGLGVKVHDTDFGRMIEMRSNDHGGGALIRWYPEQKSGVVILFNSDTGMDAAERMAHLALGGV